MQSSLKKSLYVGLAALSFASVAAVSSTASAKSYATAGAYTALNPQKTGTLTGTNAIYSKPGTVKGAKVVASVAKVKELAASKSSKDSVLIYGQKTTNRGSVYYKVVTNNKAYRGYVYGGKDTTKVAAGLSESAMMKDATMPGRTIGYRLADVSKNTLWNVPSNTAPTAKKVSLYGVKADDTFTVDKAQTKAKEGSLYYHVTDNNNKAVSGWIYAGKGYNDSLAADKQDMGGLTFNKTATAATANNSVKIIYVDGNTTVGTTTWVNENTDATKLGVGNPVGTTSADVDVLGNSLQQFAQKAPAGYAPLTTPVDTSKATYGQNIYVNVAKAATSKVQFVVNSVDNKNGGTSDVDLNTSISTGNLAANTFTVTPAANEDIASLLAGPANSTFGTNATTLAKNLGDATITGTTTYTAKNGTKYHYVFKLNDTNFASNIANVNYGTTVIANVKATLTPSPASSNPGDNSWIQ